MTTQRLHYVVRWKDGTYESGWWFGGETMERRVTQPSGEITSEVAFLHFGDHRLNLFVYDTTPPKRNFISGLPHAGITAPK